MLKPIYKKIKLRIEDFKRERAEAIEEAKNTTLMQIYTPWTDDEVLAYNRAIAINSEGNCGGNWPESKCKINILFNNRHYFTTEEYDYHMEGLMREYHSFMKTQELTKKYR